MIAKKAIAVSKFDSAKFLTSEGRIDAYLAEAMDTQDASVVTRALAAVARARNMSELARSTGLSREGLRKALSGEGNPTLETVAKVAGALGYSLSLTPSKKSAAA